MAQQATAQGTNQKDTVSGATVVTKYARLIIDQADIDHIKEIPNLPQHQQAAKTQSNEWVKNIWPLIIDTTADIIDYANTFQATYSALIDLLPQLEKGDEGAKTELKQALEEALLPTLRDKETKAKDTAKKIYDFYNGFQGLYTGFQDDFKAANKVLTEDNKEIITEQGEVTKYKLEAQTYEYSLIGTAAAIPLTIAGTAFFAETGIGLVVGGILLAGEVAAIVTLLVKYSEAMDNMNKHLQKLNDLKAEVAQLTAIEHQITGLQSNTQKLTTAATNVADGWTALADDLEKTIKHLEPITPEKAAIVIKIDLDAANKEWAVVLAQATTLQPNGGRLDSKTYKTSDEMVTAIKDQAKGA